MKPAVRWTPPAVADLLAIFEYVARDSPQAARRLRDELRTRTTALRDHPHLGRVVPELGNESIREIIHGNYRLIYRVAGGIQILAVMEGHRVLPEEGLG